MELNFNSVKVDGLPITLRNKNKPFVTVMPPLKSQLDTFIEIGEKIETAQANNDKNLTKEIYKFVATLLSRNVEDKKISYTFVKRHFNINDVTIIITSYLNFINEILETKN